MSAMTAKEQHAYLLTLATWMDKRDLHDMHAELDQAVRLGHHDTAKGIRKALEYLDKGGPEMDVERVNQHVARIIKREFVLSMMPSTHLHPGANSVPLIRISLRFDAPWMKQVQEINLEVGMAEILRAFAPLPRVHDGGFPSIAELEEMRRKKEERTRYTTYLTNEIMRGLRRMVESGDPVLGVFPDNVLEQ
jgi:hypothetical protein